MNVEGLKDLVEKLQAQIVTIFMNTDSEIAVDLSIPVKVVTTEFVDPGHVWIFNPTSIFPPPIDVEFAPLDEAKYYDLGKCALCGFWMRPCRCDELYNRQVVRIVDVA